MKQYEKLEKRRREAQERQIKRDARGDAGQLEKLTRSGHGHCKEANKLREKLTGK